MWRIAATVALRHWSGTIPALEAAPRALAAASTAVPLQQLWRLSSAIGLTGEGQEHAGGVPQPSSNPLSSAGVRLAPDSPAVPPPAYPHDDEVSQYQTRVSAYRMFVHARSRRWEKLKKNNVAYESSKYVQRAKEYNTVREDTPSIKHIEVLRQMKSWEGEEAVLKHYLEGLVYKSDNWRATKEAVQLGPHRFYAMETSYLWEHISLPHLAHYNKLAEECNEIRISKPGLKFKDILRQMPGLDEAPGITLIKPVPSDLDRECKVCAQAVSLPYLRTHVGAHILAELQQAGDQPPHLRCGFCGGLDTCTPKVHKKTLQALAGSCSNACYEKKNVSTLVYDFEKKSPVVMLYDRFDCNNWPVVCPECYDVVWSYYMPVHWRSKEHKGEPPIRLAMGPYEKMFMERLAEACK